MPSKNLDSLAISLYYSIIISMNKKFPTSTVSPQSGDLFIFHILSEFYTEVSAAENLTHPSQIVNAFAL